MTRRPKSELIKIVRTKSGDVVVDYTNKSEGRGAYVCADAKCMEKAKKRRAFSRNLKCETGDVLYDELLKIVNGK